jgi:hypothetical protein
MTNADLIALIDSLLHCMRDMDKGIGCNGCKSNIGGACIIRHRLEQYDAWRRYIMIRAMGED